VAEEADGELVLYVAPTGKAASVIRKRIKKKAYTIHQVIKVAIALLYN